jgi:hypothetical protein
MTFARDAARETKTIVREMVGKSVNRQQHLWRMKKIPANQVVTEVIN